MPSPRYTNADLERFARKPLGVKVEPAAPPDVPPYEAPALTVEDLIRAAKGSLTSAERLHNDITPTAQDTAATDAMLSSDNPSVFDSPATKLARLGRNVASKTASALDVAAIPALFVPGLDVPAGAWMGARGAQRIYEGGMQRVKEHPILTALDASMAAAPALRGLRALTAPTEAPLAEVLSSGYDRPFRQPPSSLPVPKQLAEGVVKGELPPAPATLPPSRPFVDPYAPDYKNFLESPVGTRAPMANAAAMDQETLGGLAKLFDTPTDPNEIANLRNVIQKDVQRFGGRALPPGPAEPLQLGPGEPPRPPRGGLKGGAKRGTITPRPAQSAPRAPIGQGSVPANFVKAPAAPAASPVQHAIDWEAAMAGPDPALELAGEGPTSLNASGDSAASLEALQRAAGMQQRGEQFVVYDRAGNMRRLVGPDAVDYQARPGETYGVLDRTGFRTLDNLGGRVRRLR